MKFTKFVEQVQALGYDVRVTKFRESTMYLDVMRNGNYIGMINNDYAFNYSFMLWSPGSVNEKGSYKAYKQLILYVHQLAGTEIENRGLVPDSVSVNQLDPEWSKWNALNV